MFFKNINYLLLLFFIYSCQKQDTNLVGKYKFSSSDISVNDNFKKQILELKSDNTFDTENLKELNICSRGNFEVDYKYENNELSFQCGKGFRMAHIEKGFWNTKIVF